MRVNVENLNGGVSSSDLSSLLCHESGFVMAFVQKDLDGVSSGFGHLVFASRLAAKNAIMKFNGYKVHGRHIRLTEGKEIFEK